MSKRSGKGAHTLRANDAPFQRKCAWCKKRLKHATHAMKCVECAQLERRLSK